MWNRSWQRLIRDSRGRRTPVADPARWKNRAVSVLTGDMQDRVNVV